MPEQIHHSLLNPNQLRSYDVTVKDNPFSESPIYVATEDDEFVMSLEMMGTTTRTPMDKELSTCRHIVVSSPHPQLRGAMWRRK
jgi:hypothetical protein